MKPQTQPPQKSSSFVPFKRVLLGMSALFLVLAAMVVWQMPQMATRVWQPLHNGEMFVPVARRVQVSDAVARKIVNASHAQIGTRYDAKYAVIAYPMGDVKPNRGACTDVIVRALRATGHDLQALIHRDMKARPQAYPNKWGLKAPNPNIDHRRVPNQMAFFQRHGRELTKVARASTWKQWKPGDIVFWNSGGGRQHTGIISDGVAQSGEPFVIHNGSICIEDHALNRWPIIGHFRFPS